MLGVDSTFLRLQPFDTDADGFAEVIRLKRKRVRLEAGDIIIFEGQRKRRGYLLLAGWACAIRHLKDGSGQVLDFRIPGDLLGMGELMLPQSLHSFEAITPVELCEISFEDAMGFSTRAPRLAVAILRAVASDQAIMTEHMVNIGRRSPKVRTAHLFLELAARLSYIGKGTPVQFQCPLSQYVMADALGLTAVHLNRVLRQLREDGLVSFRRSVVTIYDRARMVELTGFDPAYLDQEDLALDSPIHRLSAARSRVVDRTGPQGEGTSPAQE